jgi:hypothetical protein
MSTPSVDVNAALAALSLAITHCLTEHLTLFGWQNSRTDAAIVTVLTEIGNYLSRRDPN